jgi:hypothetical protein
VRTNCGASILQVCSRLNWTLGCYKVSTFPLYNLPTSQPDSLLPWRWRQRFCETLITIYETTRCNNLEDHYLRQDNCFNEDITINNTMAVTIAAIPRHTQHLYAPYRPPCRHKLLNNRWRTARGTCFNRTGPSSGLLRTSHLFWQHGAFRHTALYISFQTHTVASTLTHFVCLLRSSRRQTT